LGINFLGNKFSKKNLFYPGCLVKTLLPHIEQNYEEILTNLGVKFEKLKDIEVCCGLPALHAGYPEDFYRLVNKNEEVFANQQIGRIITLCPECLYAFKTEYSIKAEHITQTISRFLPLIPKKFDEEITYYDSCYLGRKLGVTEEPRQILRALGFEVVELDKNRENVQCCGAGGNLKLNSPRIADKIAQQILKDVKTQKIITACPHCYRHLKDNAQGIEVLELSEVLV